MDKTTKQQPTEQQKAPAPRRRGVRMLCWSVIAIVVIIAIVLMSAGAIVELYVESHDTELTGRRIEIGDVGINLLRGSVMLEEVTLYEEDGVSPFVALGGLEAHVALTELLKHHVHITQGNIERLYAQIARQEEGFNFDTLLAHFTSTEESSTAEPSATPWQITVDNLSLNNGGIDYLDIAGEQHWRVGDLNIAAPRISMGDYDNKVELSSTINEQARLNGDVTLNLATKDFTVDGVLEEFDIADTYPIVKSSVNLGSLTGYVGAKVHAEGNIADLGAMRLSGNITAHNIAASDRSGSDLLDIGSLKAAIKEVDLQKGSYLFEEISAEGYSANFILHKDGTSNFDQILYDNAEVSIETTTESLGNDMYDVRERVTVTTESEVAPLRNVTLIIDKLSLNGGALHFADYGMNTPFEYNLRDIVIESRAFDLNGNNNITLRANMPKQGYAMAQWSGSLNDFYNQSLRAMLTNIDMSDFSPYVEHYTAFPVTGGNLTFNSQNTITNGELRGINSVDTYNFAVGNKDRSRKTEFNIPLKAGIFILTDNKQHINLDLPVSGRIDAPEFSYRRIILRTLSNILVKMVSTPFNWMTPEKQEIFRHIGFNLLEPGFNSEHYARIDKIAEALKDNKSIKVRLKQRVDIDSAIDRLSELNLKIAYYNSTQVEDDKRLDMLDFVRIIEMNISRSDLTKFADAQLIERGISPEGMSLKEKRRAIFKDVVTQQLTDLISLRNRMLADYVKFQHTDLPEGALIVEECSIEDMAEYTGDDRYALTLIIDEQEVEMTNVDADSTATTPDTPTEEPTEELALSEEPTAQIGNEQSQEGEAQQIATAEENITENNLQ